MLASLLVGLGTNLLSDIFTKGTEVAKIKATELLKEKTGIDLNTKTSLTNEEKQKIIEFESNHSLELEKLALEKFKTSHDTYRQSHEMADKIASQIIRFNLPVILILVIINVLLVHYLKDNATLIAIASNIIGVAIGNLFNERQAIVNFFFGSSIGSKQKTDKMNESKV